MLEADHADILIAADDRSHRHYFLHDTKDGTAIFSTPATDVEQAVLRALDEHPSASREDFRLITDFCPHGNPRISLYCCLDCRGERGERQRAGLNWLFGGGHEQ